MSSHSDGPGLHARPVDVQELLGSPGVRYITPDFQRPFEWGEDQFAELWRDLIAAVERDDTHFMGQVILIESPSKAQGRMQIIDGQQRLTTLSILACVLREYYDSKDRSNVSDQLQTLLGVTDTLEASESRRLKLLNHDDDDDNYNLIYEGNAQDASGAVKQAYEFFSQKVSELDDEKLTQIRKTLLKDLKLIRTETADFNSAYQVFQAENGRGMDLSHIHFAKSLLFEAAAKDPQTDTDHVKRLWLSAKSGLDELGQAGARRAMSHILGVSEFNCPVQMYPKRFVRKFQDIVRRQVNDRGWTVEQFVEWLKNEAETYIQANAVGVDGRVCGWDSGLADRARQFRYKNAHGGIVLYHLYRECDDVQRRKKALDLARILNVRLNLANKTGSNKREPIYKIIRKDRGAADLLEVIKRIIRRQTPTDSALREHVANREFKQNKMTKLVLLELERGHFNSNHHTLTVDDFQTEHIAPRKAFTKEQYTTWRSEFGHDEDKFKEYRERLGNLTPLASSANARAGTNPLRDKKREYRKSSFKMTKRVCEYDDWGYQQIVSRSEDLAELVVKTWSIES